MNKTAFLLSACFFFVGEFTLFAQPQPCVAENPEMTPTCEEACIICDIDGFTGRHESSEPGILPEDFCTFVVHNAQWISFQAGSRDLRIRLRVSNCEMGTGLEMTIYKSTDCNTFEQISTCRGGRTDPVTAGTSAEFVNTEALVIGQFYYLAMDGAFGDNCDWTFEVLEGSTELDPLTITAPIQGVAEVCPDVLQTYTTEPESGAVLFDWTLDDQPVGDNTQPVLELAIAEVGLHTLCVTARNACDEAAPTCRPILVASIPPTFLEEKICEGDNFEVADTILNSTGIFEFTIVTETGCDSMVIVDLEAVPASTTDLGRVNICEGDALRIGEASYTASNNYTQVLPNFLGCDSTVVLNLFVVVCNIQGSIEPQEVLCTGTATGGLRFEVSNGTPPFSYQWSKLGSSLSGNGNIENLNEATSINTLSAGTYLVTIVDDFGNQRILIGEVVEPDALAFEVEISDYNNFAISCFDRADGSIEVLPTGGTRPYAVQWQDGRADFKREDLTSGPYPVTLTDGNDCQSTNIISLNAPTELIINAQFIHPTCEGLETGRVVVDQVVGGIGPFQYRLNDSRNSPNQEFGSLSSGNYQVLVEDGNGCTATQEGNLIAPEIPLLELGENRAIELADAVSLIPQTATFFSTAQWRDNTGLSCYDCVEPVASPTNPTTYQLTVTSKDNCTATDSITLQVLKIRDVYVPNAFSPNVDGINDVLILHAGPEASLVASFKIFSRWGALLYEENNFTPNSRIGWEGTFNGQNMESGVYLWTAHIDFIDGEQLVYSGDITLIR